MSQGTEPTIGQLAGGPPHADAPGLEQGPAAGRGFDLAKLLRSPTGPGELEGYDDHPLNIEPGTAEGRRVARGLEGLTGGARLAVVDLILGALGFMRRAAGRIGRPGPS